jgi:hypothetical protein
VSDREVRLYWLTCREDSPNACTAPITMSAEAVSSAVFLSCLEQSHNGVQFTASVLIMCWISTLCSELLVAKFNGLHKHWRCGYSGTNVNQLSYWFLTFPTFRYFSCQSNKSLTKSKSSWCNASGSHTDIAERVLAELSAHWMKTKSVGNINISFVQKLWVNMLTIWVVQWLFSGMLHQHTFINVTHSAWKIWDLSNHN